MSFYGFSDRHRMFNEEFQSYKNSTPKGKERRDDDEGQEHLERREDIERQVEAARRTGNQQLRDWEQSQDAPYEAVWNKFHKDDMKTKDFSRWIAELKSDLGSAQRIKSYFIWLDKNKLWSDPEHILDPIALAIDLENADWIEGNSHLLHVNSRLFYSMTAVVFPSILDRRDLWVTYNGYKLGLQIHGRPIAYSHADFDDYADKGIAVNSEFVLALGYDPHVSTSVKPTPRKESMLFAPLDYVLIELGFPARWIYIKLVLIMEIKQNGKAGALHLLLAQKVHPDVDPETFDRSGALSEEEFMHLQKFQNGIAFSVAKLSDGFSLLKHYPVPDSKYEDIEKTLTVISNSRLEIVATGSMMKGKPGISFPLYPDDQFK